jgi:hypothetical protein
VGVGEHAEHAEGFVVLNEAHSAHIGGQLKNRIDAFGGLKATVAQLEIEDATVGGGVALVPLVKGLDVDRAHRGGSLLKECIHQMTADESASPANQNVCATDLHQLQLPLVSKFVIAVSSAAGNQ